MFSTLWRRTKKAKTTAAVPGARPRAAGKFRSRPWLEQLEDRCLLSGTIAWTGPSSAELWSSAANWTDTVSNAHRVPGSADDVFIAAGNDVWYVNTTDPVHSLQDLGSLELRAGTLTVQTTVEVAGSFVMGANGAGATLSSGGAAGAMMAADTTLTVVSGGDRDRPW